MRTNIRTKKKRTKHEQRGGLKLEQGGEGLKVAPEEVGGQLKFEQGGRLKLEQGGRLNLEGGGELKHEEGN